MNDPITPPDVNMADTDASPPSNARHSADADVSDTPRTRRRWFQFRLRTLLFIVTLSAFPLAWLSSEIQHRRKEKDAVAWVQDMGGSVEY